MTEVKADLEKAIKPKVTVSSEEPQPSIAVLPFVNMSGDKEQEYFSDGLAEEIINALTQIPNLKVTARTSAFAFRGKEQDITKIAETLRVSTILEGSVRASGNRIRVTAQLVSAADGYHLWSQRYDREMTDVFEIQDEICQAIVDKLRVQLRVDAPLIKRHTENLEAYNLCLKGRYQALKMTDEGLAKSKDYFEQAVALDPNYALAWSGRAYFYGCMALTGRISWKEAYANGRQTLMKALGINEELPDAHALLALYLATTSNWKEAEHEFSRALALAPESIETLRNYAIIIFCPCNAWMKPSR